MPSRWESSERPLFVRTVIVNGNRHAILSEVDPLCQVRRADGPCHGCSSTSGLNCFDDVPLRRVRSCYPLKRDISSELQNCLVRLRVVLESQDHKKRMKKEVSAFKDEEKSENGIQCHNWKNDLCHYDNVKDDDVTGFKRGNTYISSSYNKEEEYNEDEIKIYNGRKSDLKDSVEVVPKKANRSEISRIFSPKDSVEEILKNYSTYFFPIVYINTNAITWDDLTSDECTTKSPNNLLSDRVLQWLNLERKKKEGLGKEKDGQKPCENVERIVQTNSETLKRLIEKIHKQKLKPLQSKLDNLRVRCRQDVEEEVKQECDVETALSSKNNPEYQKYSQDLNKNYKVKEDAEKKYEEEPATDNNSLSSLLSIPEKTPYEFSVTKELQQSILNSFEAMVNIERVENYKKSAKDVTISPENRRRGVTGKQINFRVSSDDDDNDPPRLRRRTSGKIQRIKTHREKEKKENGRKCKKLSQIMLNDENQQPSEESARMTYSLEQKGRRAWSTDSGTKPQLHIFMPGIDQKCLESQDESASDTESFC